MAIESKLNGGQLDAIAVIERVCSVFSLLGSIFVIFTFVFSKAFHKPINRLVFYASFGNMMTNVGTLMSRSYVDQPDSVGCQFQGFLMQMFLPADAFWTLTMAINVYLTFYFKFDARKLRRMEIPYLIGCYGVPLIPAFAYIFIRDRHGVRVYGDATLWCWVVSKWDILRIVTFYAPIWVVLGLTFFIYIRAGHTIYLKHKQLNNFSSTNEDTVPTIHDTMATIKTTEVSVTTEIRDQGTSIGLQPLGRRAPDVNNPDSNGAYSVHISADAHSGDIADVVLPIQGQTTQTSYRAARPPNPVRRRNRELNSAAWSYAKCSLLFFTAILITWIPSSANRVYSVIHKEKSSAPLEYMSAFVLPLQGFWNALIYAVTSWNACKNLISDIRLGRRPDVTELVIGGMAPPVPPSHHRHNLHQFKPTSRSNKTYETESMTELANSRPNSDDERERPDERDHRHLDHRHVEHV